jgi:hypothetical protein
MYSLVQAFASHFLIFYLKYDYSLDRKIMNCGNESEINFARRSIKNQVLSTGGLKIWCALLFLKFLSPIDGYFPSTSLMLAIEIPSLFSVLFNFADKIRKLSFKHCLFRKVFNRRSLVQ